MAERSMFNVEKLNGKNYMSWAFRMKLLLMKEACWDAIVGEEPIAGSAIEESFKKKNEKALQFIAFSVENSELVHINKSVNGKQAWAALKAYYQQSTLSSRIRVMKKLFKMELHESGSMEKHLQIIFELFHELSEMDSGLTDPILVSVILASLNREYEPIITALEAWEAPRLTLQAVRAKLLEEWEKKGSPSVAADEVALALNIRSRLGKRNFERQSGNNKSPFLCFECNEENHMRRNCPIYLKRTQGYNKEESAKWLVTICGIQVIFILIVFLNGSLILDHQNIYVKIKACFQNLMRNLKARLLLLMVRELTLQEVEK